MIYICENCHTKNDIILYGSSRFCSEKCAKSYSTKKKRKEINLKVSNILKGKWENRTCKSDYCNNKFSVNIHSTRKFCSIGCFVEYMTYTGKYTQMGQRGGLQSAKIQNRRSKNEIYFSELCQDSFKNILCNKPIFNGWDADIILQDYKLAILWNGKWHYTKITKNHSVKQVQNRDKIKIREIKKLGYTPYIIKDLGKFNRNFVKSQFNKFRMRFNLV